MTFAYVASFDCSDTRNGFSTIQLATAGKTTFSVNVAAMTSVAAVGSRFVSAHNHFAGLGSTIGEDRARTTGIIGESHTTISFPVALQLALQAGAIVAGWGATPAGQILVAFNTSTFVYTISYSATFTVTFGNTATRVLLGYASLSNSGASSYVSTLQPNFIIVPTLLGVSTVGPADALNYEPEGIANQAVSNAGSVYGMSRTVSPLYRDWVQQYEPKAKCIRMSAAAGAPFTHQELVETCRTYLPFVVIDGFGAGTNEVFFPRTDMAHWKNDRVGDGNDVVFHVHYKTIVAGTI